MYLRRHKISAQITNTILVSLLATVVNAGGNIALGNSGDALSLASNRIDAEKRNCKYAPRSVSNGIMVLQIESLSGDDSEGKPSRGAIVQEYSGKNKVSFLGYGDDRISQGESNYTYVRKSNTRAVETMIDPYTSDKIVTKYHFTSPLRGEWTRESSDYDYTISGHFAFNTASDSDQAYLAPANYDNRMLVLNILSSSSDDLPDEAYPGEGAVVLQRYHIDATYTSFGFGPGTVDHNGTYQVNRIAPNVMVEETLQTIPELNFTAPYTMVYTYDTPYSGTWYQNFGNGLIIFSGTFTTFIEN